MHPRAVADQDECLHCQLPVTRSHAVVDVASGADRRGLLHEYCAAKWKVSRRTHARRQLSWLWHGGKEIA
jgi:hypothetical protein